MLAIFAYSTTWSTCAPADSSGNLTHYPPRDYGEWDNYIPAIVTRYKSGVDYWEVWNEPDLAEFCNGTPAQYAPLLAVTSSTIKQIDPTATVVLGGQGPSGSAWAPGKRVPDPDPGRCGLSGRRELRRRSFPLLPAPEQAPEHFAEFETALTRFRIGDKPRCPGWWTWVRAASSGSSSTRIRVPRAASACSDRT